MGSHRAIGAAACVGAVAALVISACDERKLAPLDGEEQDEAGADAGDPAPPRAEPGRHTVTVVETRRIVPSDGLPADARPDNSNNNLDVIRHAGRVFLAWRTAPDHFASDKTRIVVVSSEDEITWRLEATFTAGTDLREPRLLALGDALFLYISELGNDPLRFEPRGVRFTRRGADGTWSALAPALRTTRLAAPDRDAGAGDPDAGDPDAGTDAGDPDASTDAGTDAGDPDAGDPDAGTDAGAGGAPGDPMTGYIAWRTRTERGVPYMTAYLGGEHIYAFDGLPLDVELLTTRDGVTWGPVGPTPESAVVYRGGGSETDFAIGDDGALFGVIRNEAGDTSGWGSKVCRAEAGALFRWTCVTDKKKYDSPLVFWHDGEAYLVGRRNVTETGDYDLGSRELSAQGETLKFQLDYRKRKKRCAIWRFVPGEQRVAYLLDLPSRGDTCFAARITTTSPTELAIYNYSSDVDGPDVSWADGQAGPTYVYRHLVRFSPR